MSQLKCCLATLVVIGFLGNAIAQEAPSKALPEKSPSPEGVAFFEKKIRPVLTSECFACHATVEGKKLKGGLSLESREGMRQGGESGPAIVPGEPKRSLLIKALSHADQKLSMPPKKKLDESIVRDFEDWVRMGAPDPREGNKPPYPKVDINKGRDHWAYQPPKKAAEPSVKNSAWPRNWVDQHILAGLEAKGLAPVADAGKATLLRRVTFDLTGLPPTPDQVKEFVADNSPRAFENLVDRLLASRGFGEKWARHWLDVARYAESTGKTVNFNYPHAWRYRDYVIAAFNTDKPYNQFIKEQIAGDLMKADDPVITAERMIATGFLAIGPKILNERSGLKFELDLADEQIDVTSQAFLGVTAACARCHDHKFDPIQQKDYYALAGIFRSTETCYGTVRYINAQRISPLLPLSKNANPTTAVGKLTEVERQRIEGQLKTTQNAIRNMKDPIQQFLSGGQVSLLQARLDAYDSDLNPKLLAMGVRDKPTGAGFNSPRGRPGGFAGFTNDGTRAIADSPIYTRGESEQPGTSRVPRGTLEILTKIPLKIEKGSSGRLELAEWIASQENPLTARVMVNRIWLHLFGRGLVPTANDFGLAGRLPTHPLLLDQLAIHFMDNGWSTKKLIKHLVMSRVYQLDSIANREAMEVDPDNTLYWRMSPRRLDAEGLRDAMLSVGGQLNPVPPVGSAVAKAGEGPVGRISPGGDSLTSAINDPRNNHRSIYLPILRDRLPEILALFDMPDPVLISSDRPTTTVPSQGLFILNNPFVIRLADGAADRLLQIESTESDRIREAYLLFFGRQPSAKEKGVAVDFLLTYRAQLAKDSTSESRSGRELWSAFCQALFASAEFQYRR